MSIAWFKGAVNNDLADFSAGNYKDAESGGSNVTPVAGDDIYISDASYGIGNVILGSALSCRHLYGKSADTGGSNNFSNVVDLNASALSASGNLKVRKLDTGSSTGSSCSDLNIATASDYSGGGIITVSGDYTGKGGGFGETGGVRMTGASKVLDITNYGVLPNLEIESGASITTNDIIYLISKFHVHGTLTCNSPCILSHASGISDIDFSGGTIDGTGSMGVNNNLATNGTINIALNVYNGVILPARTYGGLVNYDEGYAGFSYALKASGTYNFNGGLKFYSVIAHTSNSLDFNACDVTINGLDMADTKTTTNFDFDSATIKLKGNIDLAALGTVTKGTATIEINGTAAQDIKFNDKDLPPVEVTNAAGIVTFSQGFTSDLTCDTPDASMKFQAGEDFIGDFALAGSAGHNVVLQSTSAGTAWNLIGSTTSDYCSVKDSNSDTPVYPTHFTDNGGNTNWKYWTLTVTDGTGDGTYESGEVVAISADAPPAHQEFDVWTGDTAYLDDDTDPTTNVTMPAAAVAVTATYKDILYGLTVNNGTGSGSFAFGSVNAISANAPAPGFAFDVWTGDTAYLDDPADPTTNVTMPGAAIGVTATYVALIPVADFSAVPLSGFEGSEVAFTDLSTNAPMSWLWDFGDLSSSTLKNPTHVYVNSGVYTVKLTATNAFGSDDETKTGYITITERGGRGLALLFSRSEEVEGLDL